MTLEQNRNLEQMGQQYFARKDVMYDLLVANRNEQQKNINTWLSLQQQHSCTVPIRYFPQCILDAANLIQSEDLTNLRDALNDLVIGLPDAFERIRVEYKSKMDEMNVPIKMLQDALIEAELEHTTLMKLQRLIADVDGLRLKWGDKC